MNKADLLEKMNKVSEEMQDLHGSMRQFANGIGSQEILTYAEQLKGAIKKLNTWINGIEEDITDE